MRCLFLSQFSFFLSFFSLCHPRSPTVNSKSGDNQGIKFLKRFKQQLNPAQVFDLVSTGPGFGLRLFRHFELFRILICSGDGTVGWVLSEIDRLNMHVSCRTFHVFYDFFMTLTRLDFFTHLLLLRGYVENQSQKQCQIAVLPLGTGNDLARVLGWGSSADDESKFVLILFMNFSLS